jgi:O-acetylhomoserine (thiol)-lyase
MVDATFATPYLCRPIEHGCDIVIHSATKWIGGHGIAIGGAVIDSGRFDWQASGKFPTLSEACPAYHGIAFAEEFGPLAFLMRARAEGLRDFGACMSPANAFHLLQGVETLPLRMERHVANAHRVLDFLASSDEVAWVNHPDLPSHPDHALARRLFPKGAGSIISFGIKGGAAAGGQFIDALQMILRLVNIGDAKSLACHPASTTHRQLGPEELARAGVSEDLVRISVGIEHIDDIIADVDQALASVS